MNAPTSSPKNWLRSVLLRILSRPAADARLLAIGAETVESRLGCRASLFGKGSQPLAWTAQLGAAGRACIDTSNAGKPISLICDGQRDDCCKGCAGFEALRQIPAEGGVESEVGAVESKTYGSDRDSEGAAVNRFEHDRPSAARSYLDPGCQHETHMLARD